MTGKGLLACIDLAWIGLALASLVWSEAQPGIGGQAVSLSCCQVASWSWHWAAAWEYQVTTGFTLNKSRVKQTFFMIFYKRNNLFHFSKKKVYKKKVPIRNILIR